MRFPILFLISMLFLSYGCSPDGGTEEVITAETEQNTIYADHALSLIHI